MLLLGSDAPLQLSMYPSTGEGGRLWQVPASAKYLRCIFDCAVGGWQQQGGGGYGGAPGAAAGGPGAGGGVNPGQGGKPCSEFVMDIISECNSDQGLHVNEVSMP